MTTELEIICVGNELLIGKVSNTNASWLGKYATSLGIAVRRITVCPDEIPEIAEVIREALARKPNFLITTGGLGPTFDDKTLAGVAKALNRKLSLNEEAFEMVKAKYKDYGKTMPLPEGEMTPPRVKMATLPEETVPLANPVGTAPGVRADVNKTILIVLPGVPKEMEAIFEATVAPLLKQASRGAAFYETSIFADEIMESVLAPLIDKVMYDNPSVYIKSHPRGRESKPHMELHLSISAKPEEHPEDRLEKAAKALSVLIEEAGGKISSVDS